MSAEPLARVVGNFSVDRSFSTRRAQAGDFRRGLKGLTVTASSSFDEDLVEIFDQLELCRRFACRYRIIVVQLLTHATASDASIFGPSSLRSDEACYCHCELVNCAWWIFGEGEPFEAEGRTDGVGTDGVAGASPLSYSR